MMPDTEEEDQLSMQPPNSPHNVAHGGMRCNRVTSMPPLTSLQPNLAAVSRPPRSPVHPAGTEISPEFR